MKRIFLCIALIASRLPAAQYGFELNPESTKIEWTLGDVLHTVHGTFNLKSGKISFDSDTGKASGQVAVDVTSGNSGSGERDRRMHSNVLESVRFPEAVFTPDRFEGRLMVPGNSNVKLHGVFRIHGGDHEVTMDVTTKATSDRMEATIRFALPYVAWGMKDPSNFLLKVNKSVMLSIQSTGTLRTN